MPGTMIRKIREQRKVTQEDVARHMGISQNAYSKIENGLTQLTVNHVKQISEALGIPAIELLRDDFEVHRPLSFQAQSVSRETLLQTLDMLRDKLMQKIADQHEMYPLFQYQLQTADNILMHID